MLEGRKSGTSKEALEREGKEACRPPTRSEPSKQQDVHSTLHCTMPKSQTGIAESTRYSHPLTRDTGGDDAEDLMTSERRKEA
mmetsp:Transcript_5283/g.33182  ORF Transcript_5283/g.33182 Transcript_5283/m.33182 type:complete len:83 (-) Transcript_5283:597-845(-)